MGVTPPVAVLCWRVAEMGPFYERVCATLGWPVNDALLAKLKYVSWDPIVVFFLPTILPTLEPASAPS